MTSKNSETQEQATNGLDDIMQDVANQLSNDLYDIPQNTAMDKELDSIDKKLADTTEELNLDDDIINLLESDGEFDLPTGGGLSYEEPKQPSDNDFAATLAAESMATSQNDPAPQAQAAPYQDAPQSTEDPLLLLDDELSIDTKPSGGILGKIALAFAILASGGAGYAVWQGMASKHQTQEIISQIESTVEQSQAAGPQPNPLYDQKIAQLEQQLEFHTGKLEAVEGRLDQQAQTLEDQQGRLGQILEKVKQQDSTQLLGGIEHQLKQLTETMTGLDERLTQGQKELENQQTQLGKDLEQRLESMSKVAAAQAQEQAQTQKQQQGPVVIAEPVSKPIAETETAKEAPAKPKPARVKKQIAAPKTVAAAPVAPKRVETQVPQVPQASNGPWVVNLASTVNEKEARTLSASLQRSGIFPKIKTVKVKGATWYRLHIDGFANAAAAKRYADSVRGKPGLGQAWAGKAD